MPPPLNLISYLVQIPDRLYSIIDNSDTEQNVYIDDKLLSESEFYVLNILSIKIKYFISLEKVKCYSIAVLKNQKINEVEKEKTLKISDQFKVHQQKLDKMEKKIEMIEQKLDKLFDAISAKNNITKVQ